MGETIEIVVDNLQGVAVLYPLLQLSPDAMFVVDEDGKIVGANPQLGELFGYDPDEMLGMGVEQLVPDDLRNVHQQHRAGYMADSRRREMGADTVLHAKLADGQVLPVQISINPVRITGVRYVVGAVRDTSEREAAKAILEERKRELERSNRELEQFAYVASHDLQEPLRMVSSYSQLLARRYQEKLGDDAVEFIDFIVDGAARMQALIDDLLLLSRVGRGGEFEVVQSQTAFDRAVANLKLRIEDEKGQVTHDPLLPVIADKGQLTQLFQNLIGNALKFHDDEPPRVHVGCRAEGDRVVFTVVDNGIGIEAQYLERIFAVFQRLHARGQYEGTGIGLAICKKIVERHGGNLAVTSTPGEGTTFRFTLKRAGGQVGSERKSDH